MAVVCPKCGGKAVNYEGKTVSKFNMYERSKTCTKCGCRFTTVEKVGRIIKPSYMSKQRESYTGTDYDDLLDKFGL